MNNLYFSEYQNHKQCYFEGGRNVNECTESNLEIIDRFVDSIAGNSLNLLCTEFDNSDKCLKLEKLPKNKNAIKYKSFFIPSIEVLSSLPEN